MTSYGTILRRAIKDLYLLFECTHYIYKGTTKVLGRMHTCTCTHVHDPCTVQCYSVLIKVLENGKFSSIPLFRLDTLVVLRPRVLMARAYSQNFSKIEQVLTAS